MSPVPTRREPGLVEHLLAGSAVELVRQTVRGADTAKWFGVAAVRNPCDFWVFQEIFVETDPEVIIEVGNYHGGTLLAHAHLCDIRGRGRVIGIDIDHSSVPAVVRNHPRITLVEGDAASCAPRVREIVAGARAMCIEDSSHAYDNTLAVLRTYADMVSEGCYLIVDDTIYSLGVLDTHEPNLDPMAAVETFLAERTDFASDRSRERFGITNNPRGFLLRSSA